MKIKITPALSIAAIAAAIVLAVPASAQTPAGKGLDSLDERDVYTNLISHKLTELAKSDMDSHKVAAAEQAQLLSLASLSMLKDESLSASQRRALAVSAANGLQGILPKTEDANVLNDDADILVKYGVGRMVDNLDYFGPNPDAEKQLLPAAQTAKDLYTKASGILNNEINVINGQITAKNMAAMMAKGKSLVDKQLLIDYSNNMTSYAVCIGLPAGSPKIAQTANDAIAYLKQFDNAKSGVQGEVKIAIGKLNMAKGDYAGAKAMFDPVIAGGSAITPAASPGQQYKARYFAVLSELEAKDLKKADVDVESLDTWQQNNLHLSVGDMTAVQASVAMLHFRIDSAESDAAGGATTAAGKAFNDKGISTLVKLLQANPGNSTLEDLVFDQIRGRIGPSPDYKSLDTLALLAIQTEGRNQFVARAAKPVDPATIEKAIAASQELVKRKGQAGVDVALADRSSRFIAYAYQFCLNNEYEAAAAYLDYLTDFKADPDKSENVLNALKNCESIFHEFHAKQLNKDTPTKDLEVINALYDRFYPLAIGAPYNEKFLAFPYGMSLYAKHKWADAAVYLAMIEPGDKRSAFASYVRMLALDNILNDTAVKIPADQRKGAATQIVEAAEKAAKLNFAAAAAADVDPKDKPTYIERAIDGLQTAAERQLSDLKDPVAALKDLDGIEEKSAPLEEGRQNAIHIKAMRNRCLIYLSTDDTAKALATNLDLLKVNPPAGQQLLFEVNSAIDHDLNAAVAAKDSARVKQLTVARADLTGKIVDYVATDPKLKDNLPAYQLYDAQSQQAAAELLDEGPERVAKLQAALAQYDKLLKQYAASGIAAKLDAVNVQVQKAKTPDQALLDKQAELLSKSNENEQAASGAGLVSFDLGDYQRCIDLLSPLIGARHVGAATMEDDNHKLVEYARYWEVMYKFYQSQVNLALKDKAHPDEKTLAIVKTKVANEYLLYKDGLGGTRWHEQWMALLKQVKP